MVELMTDTVTVACAVPGGITMRVYELTQVAFIYGPPAAGTRSPVPVASGFALTPHVDAALVKEWLRANAGDPRVVNRRIYSMDPLPADAPAPRAAKPVMPEFEPELESDDGDDLGRS
jgi:hypothetical protein